MDPLNTQEMAKYMMNGVKLVSAVTYGYEIVSILSTMEDLSGLHFKIDDPPHDMEIQVKKYFCSHNIMCFLKLGW